MMLRSLCIRRGWMGSICAVAAIVATTTLMPSPVAADIVPDYDFEWATIGDPGNAAWTGIPTAQYAGRGSVDYLYRMTQTEVTVSQWFEFVQAYQPFAGDQLDGLGFFDLIGSSGHIQYDQHSTGSLEFSIAPGADHYPADMSWRMAARYTNWLHNDKALNREAFESGAYDTSTFTSNPDFSLNDQLLHSVGARFWIPSLDEWMKAGYYDPALNGGAGGWWTHPGMSDVPLTVGLPGMGGQTNAAGSDFAVLTGVQLPLDVGSYPGIQSPWGIQDMSGGASEWTEESGIVISHISLGSHLFSGLEFGYEFEDRVGSNIFPFPAFVGIRLASAIPAPGSAGLLMVAIVLGSFRRRKRCSEYYRPCLS